MKKKLLITLCCALFVCFLTCCAPKKAQTGDWTINDSTTTESTPTEGDGETDEEPQPITDGGNYSVGDDYE